MADPSCMAGNTSAYVIVAEKIDHRSHDENPNEGDDESRFPIAKGESVFFRVFAEDEKDNRRDNKIQNDFETNIRVGRTEGYDDRNPP
ncbi:MAG: hypothetical protein U0X93_14555 [Anaerolineales bacterium]